MVLVMSPAGQRRGSLPHSNPIVAHGVENSNSTANKFLGVNTRRPWMVSGAGTVPTATTPLTNTRDRPRAQPVRPVQTVPSPRQIRHNGQHNAGDEQSREDGLVERMNDSSGTTQMPRPLPSPATTSSSLPRPPSASQPCCPDKLPKQEESESTTSHSLSSGFAMARQPSAALVPNDQRAATVVQNGQTEPGHFGEPIPLTSQSGDGRTIPTIRTDPLPPPSNVPASSNTLPPPPLPSPFTPLTPTTPSNTNTASTQASSELLYWADAEQQIGTYLRNPSAVPQTWGHLERHRLRLLSTAVQQRDLTLMALHQAYCLLSLADITPASWLDRLGSSGILSGPGLDAVKQCLGDNQQLRPEFLHWAARVPRIFIQSLTSPQYTKALWEAGVLLSELGKKWSGFGRAVYNRAYPPLISELSRSFPTVSTIIKYMLWASLCQIIIPMKNESVMAEYRVVYDCDCAQEKAFESPDPPRTSDSIRQDRQLLINRYLHIAQKHSIYPGRLSMASIPPQPLPGGPVPNTQTQIQFHPVPQPILLPQQHAQLSSPSLTGVRHHPPPQHPPSNTSTPLHQVPVLRIANHSHPPHGVPAQGVYPAAWGVVPRSGIQTSNTAPTAATAIPRRGRLPNRLNVGSTTPSGTQPGAGANNLITAAQPQVSPGRLHLQPNVPLSSAQVQPRHPTPFLPPAGETPITMPKPNPSLVAAHQLNLRSPPTTMMRSCPDGNDQIVDFLQYLHSFTLVPTPLGFTEPLFRWKILISEEHFARLPRFPMSNGPKPCATRILSKGSLSFLLRCCRLRPSDKTITESTWSTMETTWPSVFYIHVNDQELSPRRKVHWSKDSALDITKYLRSGDNEMTFHIIRSQAEAKGTISYALAVEVHEANTFKHIRKRITVLSSAISKEKISQRLSSITNDDDLAVIDDYISIGLIDPFTARIFKIPVRGRSCTHWECFDLDTFLQTRLVKSRATTANEIATTFSRTWKCPICGKDARPKSLYIDGFLMEVHTELKSTQSLDNTRSIQVKKDGSWSPVHETSVSTPQASRATTETATVSHALSANEIEPGTAQACGVKRSHAEFIADDDNTTPQNEPRETVIIELD